MLLIVVKIGGASIRFWSLGPLRRGASSVRRTRRIIHAVRVELRRGRSAKVAFVVPIGAEQLVGRLPERHQRVQRGAAKEDPRAQNVRHRLQELSVREAGSSFASFEQALRSNYFYFITRYWVK